MITPSSKAKTQVLEILETVGGKKYHVKNSGGFQAGDIVMYADKVNVIYNRVVKSQDNIIEFEQEFDESVIDKSLLPAKVITTCEFNLEVRADDQVELYENVSFNIESANYVDKKTAKSELVEVHCLAGLVVKSLPRLWRSVVRMRRSERFPLVYLEVPTEV